ncbi:MAG: hypothetical protein MMC23_010114, partial [Stictis urceolatum]|nr:hypothetical protein [Stictis urceolata]
LRDYNDSEEVRLAAYRIAHVCGQLRDLYRRQTGHEIGDRDADAGQSPAGSPMHLSGTSGSAASPIAIDSNSPSSSDSTVEVTRPSAHARSLSGAQATQSPLACRATHSRQTSGTGMSQTVSRLSLSAAESLSGSPRGSLASPACPSPSSSRGLSGRQPVVELKDSDDEPARRPSYH